MLLRIASDLHLEAFYGCDPETLTVDFIAADARDKDAILVLAGDISSKPDQLVDFLNMVAQRFVKVLYVPGNHEYYRHDFDEWNSLLKSSQLKPNIVACAEEVLEHVDSNVRFLMTTLWGDGGKTLAEQTLVDYGLNDFRIIRQHGARFSVLSMIAVHKRQKAELEAKLKTPFAGKTVVISHHMPSYRLCHPRFGNSINGGFASNCDDILAYDHAPALWIHGHTHDRISTRLWKTAIECNPAGYRGEWGTPFNTYLDGPVFIDLENLGG